MVNLTPIHFSDILRAVQRWCRLHAGFCEETVRIIPTGLLLSIKYQLNPCVEIFDLLEIDIELCSRKLIFRSPYKELDICSLLSDSACEAGSFGVDFAVHEALDKLLLGDEKND